MANLTRRKATLKPTEKPAGPPPPFVYAPTALKPFVERLFPASVYVVHIDRTPRSAKGQMFALSLLINSSIVLLIAYRFYVGMHVYPYLVLTALGYADSPTTIDTSMLSRRQLLALIVQRAAGMMFDYLLLTVFSEWPWRFWHGPLHWRRTLGFLPGEVVVRKSRAWSDALHHGEPGVSGSENGPETAAGSGKSASGTGTNKVDNSTLRDRLRLAIAPERIDKTGYLLIDADWDLDFSAMLCAHELVRDRVLSFDDFTTAVFVHSVEGQPNTSSGNDDGTTNGNDKDATNWLIWRVDAADDAHPASASSTAMSTSERAKIRQFQDKLAAMGHEDLFFRWAELIQYESTRPGGFTPERQLDTMRQTRELFEERGVDFERFWEEVGGMKEVGVET